jgi:DNA helicase-2/ATP-dependent DNA helicase PcrA
VINTPPRGIGGKTLDTLRELARERQLSLWRAMAVADEERLLPARALGALRNFCGLIDELDNSTQTMTLEALTAGVVRDSGLVELYRREKGEKGEARVENLEELANAARQFSPEPEGLSPLEQFLDAAALDAGERQADAYEDSVQLMTLHSAKGLEFPLVFLAGMEENLFPHRMSVEEPGRLEEERRLCYVGITRAMQQLVLSYAESRRTHGTDNYNAPSRFLREIPAELVQEVRLQGTLSRPMSALGQPEAAHGAFALGQRVLHPLFGEGVVLDFEGRGSHARIEVNFDGEGSKWLVLQYARLEAL